MDRPGNPPVETTGKVLTFPSPDSEFPPPAAEAEASAAGDARVNVALAMRRRRRQAKRLGLAWMLLAWILAASRLSFAVTHRQVFGIEASAAFLLVVSLPLILARRVAGALRSAAGALCSARRRRRGADEPAGPDARLQAGGRSGRRKSWRERP